MLSASILKSNFEFRTWITNTTYSPHIEQPHSKMSVFRKKLIACHIYDIYDTYTAGTQNAQCITNIEKNCSSSKNVSKAKFVHRMISSA